MVKSTLRQTNKQKASLTCQPPLSLVMLALQHLLSGNTQHAAWASFLLIALLLPGGLRAPGFLQFQTATFSTHLLPFESSSTCKLQSDGFTCILYLFCKIFHVRRIQIFISPNGQMKWLLQDCIPFPSFVFSHPWWNQYEICQIKEPVLIFTKGSFWEI